MKTIIISALASLHFLFTIPLLALEHPSHEKERMEYFLDGVINTLMDEHRLTAAILSVVEDGEVLIEKAYGHFDLETRQEAGPRSQLFRIGSISKLFAFIAVLQQVEAGSFISGTCSAGPINFRPFCYLCRNIYPFVPV